MDTIILDPKVAKRVNQLSSELQGLINTGCEMRPWSGKVDKINPTTGEKTGERITANLDVHVSEEMFVTVDKALEAIKKSGKYIEVTINGVKLVAIKARMDEMNNKFIVQFAKPNVANWLDSNSNEFKSKFNEVFSSSNAAVESAASFAQSSATVNNSVPAGANEDDDLPF